MTKKRRRNGWYIDELPEAVRMSYNMREVIRTLGLSSSGDMYVTLQHYISQLNLDTSHWIRFHRTKGLPINPNDDEIFIVESKWSNRFIRQRIIKRNLMPYNCAVCGLDRWNNKPISLQLDHINGNNRDNRLDNLRLLCPNCHSQTENWGARKRPNRKDTPMSVLTPSHVLAPLESFCQKCEKKISRGSKLCQHCAGFLSKPKIEWPPLDELVRTIEETSYLATARQLGVSDNAIKKHLRRRGIEPPHSSSNAGRPKRLRT